VKADWSSDTCLTKPKTRAPKSPSKLLPKDAARVAAAVVAAENADSAAAVMAIAGVVTTVAAKAPRKRAKS